MDIEADMSATRRLADLITEIAVCAAAAGKAGQVTPNKVFEKLMTHLEADGTVEGLFVEYLALFDRAASEILSCTLPDEQKERHVLQLEKFKLQFVKGALSGNVSNLLAAIRPEQMGHTIWLLGDLYEAGQGKAEHRLDRNEFVKETLKLVQSLDGSSLPDYAQNALRLKLCAVMKMVNHASVYPDDQIRLRIKAVVADFCSEFETMDDAYKSYSEKLVSWGKKYSGGGFLALGLLADSSQVAGLLSGPK